MNYVNYELSWLNNNCNIYNLKKQPINENFKNDVVNYFNKVNIDFNYIDTKNIQRVNNAQFKALYYQGNIGLLKQKYIISIIGTRKPTHNGLNRTTKLVKELSYNIKPTFMSGLAKGIDTCVMQTALKCNSNFIGVIGTPLNRYYPLENKNFQIMLAKQQLILSHVPFYKYSKQPLSEQSRYFLERNYVMAILSNATIITEAFENSGTFHQALACLQNRRKVFILNSCYESNFKWVKKLDKIGAIKVKKIEDILDNL
ncbi:DNA-processing protein DprA [Campylobacter sp. RM12651]|uniref:DNA-processing protein DprA n=1 Tax=Campylobacter sp. RM12651 TaxID=1660079 RepID=UPI001EFAABE0|nr:DNA-processing protein DprA [Campylobacter sp. RM12651]ULO03794.1 DNA protecting protein, DprA family [Campylobacter sp. RM12651]